MGVSTELLEGDTMRTENRAKSDKKNGRNLETVKSFHDIAFYSNPGALSMQQLEGCLVDFHHTSKTTTEDHWQMTCESVRAEIVRRCS